MTIKVSCPCGQKFTAKDELEGQTLLCPKCHQPLTIGAEAAAGAAPARKGGIDDLLEDVGLKEVKGKRCPSCGAGMLDVAVICVECGFNLQTGGKVQARLPERRAKAGTADHLLERAAETIETEKLEDKKIRAQGTPAWALFAALIIVVGFAATMYLMPRDEAFFITGVAFMVLGGLVATVYGIGLIVIAFKEDLVCGLLYLFLPFYSLYYVITRWSKCSNLVIKSIVAGLVIGLGAVLAVISPSLKPDENAGLARPPLFRSLVAVDLSNPLPSRERDFFMERKPS